MQVIQPKIRAITTRYRVPGWISSPCPFNLALSTLATVNSIGSVSRLELVPLLLVLVGLTGLPKPSNGFEAHAYDQRPVPR